MRIKIKIIGAFLQKYTDGQEVIEINGNTVGECLVNLTKQFPGEKPWLFQKQNEALFHGIVVLVNEEALQPLNLDKRIRDGDEISLIFALIGG